MKKITRLIPAIIVVVLFAATNVFSKNSTLVPTYLVNENFDGKTTLPTGWATGTVATASGSFSVATNRLNFSASGSGGRGMGLTGITATTSLTDTVIHYDFDYCPNSPTVRQLNITIRDNSKQAIMAIIVGGNASAFSWGGRMLLVNRDTTIFKNQFKTNADILLDVPDQTGSYVSGGTTYNATTTAAAVQAATLSTYLGDNFTAAKNYSIAMTLNFVTKRIRSITITDKADATTTVTYTDLPFINSAATNLANLDLVGTRPNSSNTTAASYIDNLKIYTLSEALTANVTINYLNSSGVAFKTASIVADQVIGSTYTALASDKATYSDATNYYIYDAASTTTDNVVVLADGSSAINLKFKTVPKTAATYTWTGATNSLWNNSNENFTTDGLNSIIYQETNPVVFPASATNKTVTVNDIINLGSSNATIEAPGYTISGLASLNGTGSLLINLTGTDALTLGAINNLTGTTQITGGNITVTKSGVLGAGANITGVSTLSYGATAITIPAITFGASSSLVAGSFASSLINGMSAGNGVKISVSAGVNHASNDNSRAFDFAASGTLDAGSELELNGTGTDNRIGMTTASTSYLATAKVTLKGAAMLYINSAQGAATTISIGTLAGETGTKLGWGRTTDLTRTITWSVGASNESSIFAGSITNTGGYATSGSSYLGNQTNFIKTGAGTLTMSGTANTHNGNFVVNGGELNVTGAICNTTATSAVDTVCVNTGTKLSGNGTVGGNTSVYDGAILEGSLHFGGSLKLTPASTVNLVVNDFATLHDSITVTGAATYGGTLNISVPAALPAYGTTVKLLYVGSYTGTFAVVNVPAGYKFDEATGTLNYGFYSKLSDVNSKLSVYPTLTNGIIHIQGGESVSAEVVNLSGQAVKVVNLSSNKSTINLGDLSTGSYLLKVRSVDGSVSVQKVVLQK